MIGKQGLKQSTPKLDPYASDSIANERPSHFEVGDVTRMGNLLEQSRG